jgi:plastocyanin
MNARGSNLFRSGLSLAVAGLLIGLGLVVVHGGQAAGRSAEPAAVSCNTIITTATSITQNTMWTEAQGPFCVRAAVQVNAGFTLQINPGVGVYFGPNGKLDVLGTLTAEGTEEKGIIFSSESASPAAGDWVRLYVTSGGHASLAYCEIAFGGHDGDGFRTDATGVTINQCHIHHNQGNGVRIFGGGASPTVKNSTIDHNTGAGIYIRGDFSSFHNQPLLQNLAVEHNGGAAVYLASGESGHYTAFPAFDNLTFTGNGSDALNMQGSGIQFDLTMDSPAWFNGKPIVVVSGSLEPQLSHTLTLARGTSLQFSQTGGYLLAANGNTIVAEGTAEQPITLGPDPAHMQPGAWKGVKVWAGSHLSLAHCDLGYAGNDGMGLLIQANDVQVRNCRIHDNLGYGVKLWGAGGFSARLEDTQIDHNSGAAIYEAPGEQQRVPTYLNLTFAGNGSDALNLDGALLDVDRTLDGAGQFNGAPIVLLTSLSTSGPATLTITPGTTIRFDHADGQLDAKISAVGTAAQPIRFTSNKSAPQPGDWARIILRRGSRLAFCGVAYGGGSYYPAALEISDYDVQVRNCRVQQSAADGLAYSYYDWGYYGPETARFENLALTDNAGAGLRIGTNSHAEALHTTLARNGSAGVYVQADGALDMTNTIVAHEYAGAVVEGDLSMAYTLWGGNVDNVLMEGGSFSEAAPLEGPAAFKADGYHIGCTSAAIGEGLQVIADDIDGETRPWPPGSLPDLGADEAQCGQTVQFDAQKVAFTPQWVVDPETGSGRFRQEYLVAYFYGSGAAAIPVNVADTLPNGLSLASQDTYPAMSFTRQGQALAWHTLQPVPPGTMGVVHIDSQSTTLPPGAILNNSAAVDAVNYWHFDLQADSTLPFVPPLLASGGDGETCTGRFPLEGSAQPGTTVKVYANGDQVATATPDASGAFIVTLTYPSTGDWTVTARACAGTTCSADSNAVLLTPQKSFWCPRQSVWKTAHWGIRQFRDQRGLFTTNNPEFTLPKASAAATAAAMLATPHALQLTVPSYPVLNGKPSTEQKQPQEIWIDLGGGEHITPEGNPDFPPDCDYGVYLFSFTLPTGVTQVNITLHVRYANDTTVYISHLTLNLIDPDGTVFDVTKGFDPDVPALNAISGITVTCMVSMTQWGGWVPWPAQLYNNQANPQVTGADGYFAFFTPPGKYYLQVDGKTGYQPWRSPVIDVITQVVHVNVPLTPLSSGNAGQVKLTPYEIQPATIDVQVGDSVEWFSTLTGDDAQEIARLTQDPVLRPVSSLDPLTSTLGWDGGMLAPGLVYRRQFVEEGAYAYSDNAGHTGTVVVHGGQRTYLPLILRH